jgi:N-methylhydantoinase A
MKYFCGVDIGGTFTDSVIMDEDGRITLGKVSSTPPNFSDGFLDALADAAGKLDLSLEELLAQSELVLHGTTVGTNVLVEMRGARTGLITTRGHRDALIMMRSAGRSAGLPVDQLLHVSRHRKPDPIVPATRIKEVSERVDWAGDVILELNEAEARAAVEELLADGVEAIAISFLWGFVHPAHELRVKAIVQELAPEVFVTCAHELIAKHGEYERTAAAAINAFIGPATSSYVREIDESTTSKGYEHPLLIMQAAGGVAPADEVVAKPLFTIASGPVGGVTGSAHLASLLGHENVIAGDVGGTSFDVGIIADGQPISSSETIINQYTFFMPRLDIESIGSGGGSIVWVDPHTGTLRVGPHSAGARPGPACYGRGGTDPTVTDCDLFLGRYNPETFLGGGLHLDQDAARAAIERVAAQLDIDPVEAADGALRIVETQMGDLMRQMTVERGRDPRDFVVYGFGGAGAAHAVEFAREIGCSQVVIPLGDLASTWSALGVMTSDVLHVYEHSELIPAPFDAAVLNDRFGELEERARGQLRKEGFSDDDIELTRVAEMKFNLQIHQVDVPVPGGELTADDAASQVDRFFERYEQLYGQGSAFPEAGSQIGLFRVLARGKVRTPSLPELPAGEAGPSGSRSVYWRAFGEFRDTQVYSGRELGSGATIAGPAIIDYPDTTVVLPPGTEGAIDRYGNVIIDVAAVSGEAAAELAQSTHSGS